MSTASCGDPFGDRASDASSVTSRLLRECPLLGGDGGVMVPRGTSLLRAAGPAQSDWKQSCVESPRFRGATYPSNA